MIINKIEAINFKQYKNLSLNLKKMDGTIGFLGKNGAGKSTIFDAILVALYGIDVLDVNKQHIRNQYVSEDESVFLKLDFTHNGVEYIIQREFKGKNLMQTASFYAKEGNSFQLLAKTSKEVQDYIAKILNIDYKTFIKTIFTRQEELNLLLSLTPNERKNFIYKLLNLEKYDEDIKKIKDRIKENNKVIDVLKVKVEELQEQESNLSNYNEQYEKLQIELENLKKELEQKEKEYKEIEKVYKVIEDKINEINNINIRIKELNVKKNLNNKTLIELKEQTNKIVGYQKYIEENKNKMLEYNNLKDLYNKVLEQKSIYERKNVLEEEIKNIKEEGIVLKNIIQQLEKERDNINYNSNDKQIVQENILKLKEKLKQKNETFYNLKATANEIIKNGQNLANEKKNLSSLKNSKCPLCKQDVTEEYIYIIEEHYEKELNRLRQELKVKQLELQQRQDEINKIEEQIKNLEEELNLINKKEKDYVLVEEKINSQNILLEEKRKRYKQKVNELQEILTKIDNEIVKLSLEKIKNNILSIEKIVQNIKVYEHEVSKKQEIEEKINSIINDNNSYDEEIANLQNKLKDIVLTEDVDSIKEQYNMIKNNYEQIKDRYIKEKYRLENLAKMIEMLNEKVEEINQDKDTLLRLENENSKCKILIDTLTKAKLVLTQRINPILNKYLNEVFNTLIDNKYDKIEINNDFEIVIYVDGKGYPIERFSAGERDIVNLSMRIAISKALEELYTNGKIEIIALDEVFSRLDDERKNNLMNVLENLSNSYKQIFIISHDDSVKSKIKNVFEVINENNDVLINYGLC